MPLLPSAPIRIQPYLGYRNRDRLRIACRALRSTQHDFASGKRWQALLTMIGQFASHEAARVPVELELEHPDGTRRRHQGLTNAEGFAHFDIRLEPEWQASAHTIWDVVAFHWRNREGEHTVAGHVLAPGRDVALGVISDIDDTIVETGITGNLRAIARNWRRVLLQMPDERLLVPQADAFYAALGGGAVAGSGPETLPELGPETAQKTDGTAMGDRLEATRHPFFYVSSSPWNLFAYIVAFLKSRGLPLGPLLLRDWGLNRDTFGSASHGAHKLEAIRTIVATFPDLRFALIGDDTQGDLVAFATVVADCPGRIRAVFIRRAGDPFTAEETAAKATIETAKVPLWLGDDYATGRQFLHAIGLANDGEAEQILDTVEQASATEAGSGR